MLIARLDREEIVPRFIDTYASEYRRPGRSEQPGHYREQVETIRREAILAMVSHVDAMVPGRLTDRAKRTVGIRKMKKVSSRARAGQESGPHTANPLVDLFREEFFVALGQALNWGRDDAQRFWRDLDMYQKLSARSSAGGKRATEEVAAGPFAERVAILLDPSLMEEARRASIRFQLLLGAAADSVLKTVFSRRRKN